MSDMTVKLLPADQLDQLISLLHNREYQVFGPMVQNDAIMYGELNDVAQLPVGMEDEQEAGFYRLNHAGHNRYFSYVPGQDNWKRFLFLQEEVLYSATQSDSDIIFKTNPHSPVKRAFFGIRSCELHAIGVQDRVFLDGEYGDPGYASRREDLLLVAVNCTRSAATCFCTSLDTGPKARTGYDLALTEVEGEQHGFLVEAATPAGTEMLQALNLPNATQGQLEAGGLAIAAAAQQKRSLPVNQLKEAIERNLTNQSFWEQVGERCLHCANCTLVCPTCFCSTQEERTDLSGDTHDRVRVWDSCFNLSHSHIAGGSVRVTPASRYRQWFNHKLASWQDQFDTLGCTGCGRCITWCPVGIDITAEAHRIQALESSNRGTP